LTRSKRNILLIPRQFWAINGYNLLEKYSESLRCSFWPQQCFVLG